MNAEHEVVGEPTLADAVCDRSNHLAYRVELKRVPRGGPEPCVGGGRSKPERKKIRKKAHQGGYLWVAAG